MSTNPLERYRSCAAVMKSGLSSRTRAYRSARGCNQLAEQPAAHPGAAMRRLDVHALDLDRVGADPSHARCADGWVFVERQQEAAVGRLKLTDAFEVPVNGPAHGQPETVPRLQSIVAPSEVLQPKPLDRFEFPRQIRLPNLRHVASLKAPGKGSSGASPA